MKNSDYELIKDQWDDLSEKCSKLHKEWDDANGPKSPGDYPDTRAAYFGGYAQAVADAIKAHPRFALLTGDTYYPQPGWNGFDSWHETVESATARGEQIVSESMAWYQVLDTHDFKVVAGSGEAHTGLFGKVSCAVRPKDKNQ